MEIHTPKNSLVLTCLFFIITNLYTIAQVGIGITTPNESAMLDITSDSSDLLIPRISLTSTNDTTTINGTEEISLLLYNTAT